ncbi:phasin family protein [Yoonia sp.]|uniref:phasin family protein n=1 Tax=Yoonia sp. TaxID=2212373 RepID=UPI003F6D108F
MAKSPEKTDSEEQVHATLAHLQEAGLGSLAWMGTAWTEAISQLGSEMISFVAERIQEDVKTQTEILQCKSLTELQQAQAAFLERAYVQYTVETGKLIKLSTDIFPALPSDGKSTPV